MGHLLIFCHRQLRYDFTFLKMSRHSFVVYVMIRADGFLCVPHIPAN